MITNKVLDKENVKQPGEPTQMHVEAELKRFKSFEKRIKVVIDNESLPSSDAVAPAKFFSFSCSPQELACFKYKEPAETYLNALSWQVFNDFKALAPAGDCMNAFSWKAPTNFKALAPTGDCMNAFSWQAHAEFKALTPDYPLNYLFGYNFTESGAYGLYEWERWKVDRSNFFREIIDDFNGFKPYEYPFPCSILKKTNGRKEKRFKKPNRRFRRGKSKKNIFLILLLKRVRKALFVLKVQLFKATNLSNLQYLYIPDFSRKYEFIDMTNSYKEDVEFITTVKNSFNHFKSSLKNGLYKKRHKIPEAA